MFDLSLITSGPYHAMLVAGLKLLKGHRLVGADCLELAPHYDPTGVSAMTMAKTLREIMRLGRRWARCERGGAPRGARLHGRWAVLLR